MYTEQQDYNYQITELINKEIIQKKKGIRRKSCHCSECGFLTKFEKLTMGLKSYLKNIKNEEKDDSTVSMRGSSVGFRNRGKTQDPKYSKLIFFF